jgi:hypothetical protein
MTNPYCLSFYPVPLHDALNAIFEVNDIEVYKQPRRFTTELEVGK